MPWTEDERYTQYNDVWILEWREKDKKNWIITESYAKKKVYYDLVKKDIKKDFPEAEFRITKRKTIYWAGRSIPENVKYYRPIGEIMCNIKEMYK